MLQWSSQVTRALTTSTQSAGSEAVLLKLRAPSVGDRVCVSRHLKPQHMWLWEEEEL